MERTIGRPQNKGKIWMVFPPSSTRAKNSGNKHRKNWIHCKSEKHIRCTTALSRRTPWGDRRQSNNCAGNANTRLRYGRTITSKFSSYQLKLCSNGTVVTYDCDHECHANSPKKTRLSTKPQSEAKEKVLLLELQEKFQSREKNLLRKEIRTSRGSVLNMGWEAARRDMNDG